MTDSGVSPPVVIVGRSLCFEVVKHIPVDVRSEARKIATQMPIQAPFKGVRKVRLKKSEASGYDALVTVIDSEKLGTKVGSNLLALIPCSWLVSNIAREDSAQLDIGGETVAWAPVGAMGTTACVDSAEQRESFWWAVGANESSVKHVSEGDFLGEVPSALKALGLELFTEAFRGNGLRVSPRFTQLDWKKLSWVSAALGAAYLVIVTLLLNLAVFVVDARVTSEPPEFVAALQTRAKVNKLKALGDGWSESVGIQFPAWSVVSVVDVILASGALVRSFNYSDGEAEISLIAQDATKTLDAVIGSEYAEGATFSVPISREAALGIDRFSIRWSVVDADATGGIPMSKQTGDAQ